MKPLEQQTSDRLADGKTIIVVAADGKVAGVVGVQDALKPTAKLAVTRMKELGLEVAMITGDNQKTGDASERQVGITRVFAEVLPGDKAE